MKMTTKSSMVAGQEMRKGSKTTTAARAGEKALQLASSTQTSYLRLVLLKHLGLRGPQKPIHDAFGHHANHGRLRGRAKRYFRTKKKFGMTFPKNRTKKNA